MPFHIQKQSVIDPDITVYWVDDDHWSDDPEDKQTWKTKTIPTQMMINYDGKNGGWVGATVVEHI